MDFISAFGNLRARNYGIEEIDKFAAKLKARARRDLAPDLATISPRSRRNLAPDLAATSPRPCRDLALQLDLP